MEKIQKLISTHVEIWTTAETEKKSGVGRSTADSKKMYGIKKLRKFILDLAVRGKLVPQFSTDEPASELLKKIRDKKNKSINGDKKHKNKSFKQILEQQMSYELPKSWICLKLADTYQSISPKGKQLKSSEIKIKGKFPVIDQGQTYIAGYGNNDKYLIKITHPIIIFGDHTRNIKFIDFDFIAGADGTKIMAPILINPRFFYYHLLSYQLQSKGYARHFKILNENLIGIPPLAEQHRIVSKLDELMTFCDHLENQHINSKITHKNLVKILLDAFSNSNNSEKFRDNWKHIDNNFESLFVTEDSVDKLKQIVLQVAIMGKLVPQNPNDKPTKELLKKNQKSKTINIIKDKDKQFKIPVSWEWIRLGNYSIIERGGSPRPIQDFITSDPLGLNWIKIGDTKPNSKYIFSTKEKIRKEGLGKTRMVYPGDFLITNSMSFGRPYISKINGCIHDGWLRIHPSSMINKNFLYYLLMSPYVYKSLQTAASGGVVQNLNIGKVYDLIIPIPPLKEQNRIATKIDDLLVLCDQLKSCIQQVSVRQKLVADVLISEAIN